MNTDSYGSSIEWERPQTESANSRRGLTQAIDGTDWRAAMQSTQDTPQLPNGEADPARVRVGTHFTVGWAFINDDAPEPGAYVYEVFDKHLRLVYVGITGNFASRWNSHLSNSWWARSVDIRCVILSGYPTRADARKVEALLIEQYRPPCNTKLERRWLAEAKVSDHSFWTMSAELVPAGGF